MRTYPIERCCALPGFLRRQCPLPLACHHLPKDTGLELGKGTPDEHGRPQSTILPPRINQQAYVPCSADYEQEWQPPPVDPYDGYTYIHTIRTLSEDHIELYKLFPWLMRTQTSPNSITQTIHHTSHIPIYYVMKSAENALSLRGIKFVLDFFLCSLGVRCLLQSLPIFP